MQTGCALPVEFCDVSIDPTKHYHHLAGNYCSKCRCSKLNPFSRQCAVLIGLLHA